MRFKRVATIDAEFYRLGIPAIPERVYFYLSARCHTRFHVSEIEIVSALRINIRRVRAAINMLVDMRMLKRWQFPRPKCTEYVITLSTEKGWGMGAKRAYSMGAKRAPLRGPNDPHYGGQTAPPPRTNDNNSTVDGDSALLAIFTASFSGWTFNKRPAGKMFYLTRPMLAKAMEMMRHLNGLPGFSRTFEFVAFLEICREYLAFPHDPLSPQRDQRALSPAKWLGDWQNQIRMADLYREEKEMKIAHMPSGEKS